MTDPKSLNLRELRLEDRLTPSAGLVRDINEGTGASSPRTFSEFNGLLYFGASDGVAGRELWKSDGTFSGTVLVCDIRTGATGSNPNYLVNVDGTLFFTAHDGVNGSELWTSDGTSSGTILIRDIRPGLGSSVIEYLLFVEVNGTLFFAANDGIHGPELWKSDGTSSGTVLVRDIRPGSAGSFNGSQRYAGFANVNGTLFFTANNGVNGYELWKSDGTSDGTVLVRDIRPGNPGSIPGNARNHAINAGGTFYFVANDGVNGYELWKSDGTSSGTILVHDVQPGIGNGMQTTGVTDLFNHNGTLYFDGNDGVTGVELWTSDGTSSGTLLVCDINTVGANGVPRYFANLNGVLYFAGQSAAINLELWKTDGTSSGTLLVREINPFTGSDPRALTSVGGQLYFRANDGVHGIELWGSDGTSSGTRLLADIYPGSTNSSPAPFIAIGDRILFPANHPDHGRELFAWTIEPAPPQVAEITVNDGAPQRSRITAITVTLTTATETTLFQNPGAVTLTRTAGGPGTVVTIGSGLVVTPGAGSANAITLTFQNASLSGVENGSLADGRWRLAIPSLNYASPLNDPNLRRLFGDDNGDGIVDGAIDFPAFGATFNSNSNLAFDFNNDDLVDGAIDFPAFGARFNVAL